MSGAASSRRAVAELRPGAPRPPWSMIGPRSIHQFWPQLAPHFRLVLLPPQRRADSGAVTWSWRAVDGPAAPSPDELADVRRRLEGTGRAFGAAESGAGDGAPIRAAVQAMVQALITTPDAGLAGFVARTDSGLLVHSWGAAVAAHPYFPDTIDCEVSGRVVAGEEGAAGLNLVIENRQGVVLARVQTDATGVFQFQKIGPGDYRIRVTGRGDFPASGYAVTVERESITGLELHRGAAVATFSPGAVRGRARDAALTDPAVGGPVGRRGFRLRRIHFLWTGLVVVLLVGGWRGASQRAGSGQSNVASPPWWQSARGQLAALMGSSATSAPGGGGESHPTGVALGPSGKANRPENSRSRDGGAPPEARRSRDAVVDGPLSPRTPAALEPPATTAPTRAPADVLPATGTDPVTAFGGVADPAASREGAAEAAPGLSAAPVRKAIARPAPPAAESRAIPPVVAPSATAPDSVPAAETSTDRMRDAEAAADAGGRPAGHRAAGAIPAGGLAARAASTTTESSGSAAAGPEPGGARGAAASSAGGTPGNPSAAAPPRPVAAGRAAKTGRATRPPGASTTAATAAETPADLPPGARPPAGSIGGVATPAGGPSEQRWRFGVSEFKLRLVLDAVVPTTLVPDGADDAVETTRRRELRDRHDRRPAALGRATVVHGVTVELFERDVTGGPAPRWREWEGFEGAVAEVRGTLAEVFWPAGTPSGPRRWVLRHRDGRELARAGVEPDGVVSVETGAVVRAWHWIGIDCGPEGRAPGLRLDWRYHSGAPVPVTWRRDDQWRGGRGYRLDLPLASGVTGPAAFGLALVDPASGWGLAGDVYRP